jgi:amino acid adenylation domain-containing protein
VTRYLVHGALSAAAQRWPDKVAVRAEARSLTYGELDVAADRVAGALADMGVTGGDRVGLYMDKTVEAIAAIYGILRAGAAYVPLDPDAPPARCALIAQDCAVAALVADERRVRALGSVEATIPDRGIVCGGQAPSGYQTWEAVQAGAQVSPAAAAVDTDLAYILYTSGSTGRPKGVMISHRNALTFVNWACEQFSLQPADTFSSHAPFHFDLSTFDLFAAASAGGTVTVVPGMAALFPVRLAQWIGAEEVTVWYSVPSALSMLVRYGGLDQHPIDSVRLLLFAGEVFPNKYLAELMRLAPRARYFNLYGPTETNVCTFHEVVEAPAPGDAPIPIGRPCANTRCLVEDEVGNVVSTSGVEGELVVQGSIVAQGYWGNPARTAEGFPAPYTYRTGDVVQWSDGPHGPVLRFVGRRDHMVKSRGYRIELGEIETALYSHVDVEEAAAVAIPDELLGSRILAFCVAPATLDEERLKQLCRERLPAYMVPERIIMLQRLPRTPNGKVDRTQLLEEATRLPISSMRSA